MNTYIKGNKAAWEDAYDNKHDDYEKDIIKRLKDEDFPFIDSHLANVLKQIDLKGKTVGQFCSNNGRELLSLAKLGIKSGVGFDVASNMVDFGNQVAKTLGHPITFIEKSILDIDNSYHESFDIALITVGSLCWFENLHAFFKIVSKTMKKGGLIIIHEGHPFYNMLATPDEENFNKDYPSLPVNDYFKKTPWVLNSGMSYMTKDYASKEFTSFSHTLEAVFTALYDNQIIMTGFKEFDLDIANLFGHLDHKGMPLSYLLTGVKAV